MRDFYAVLGVSVSATPAQIRRAYQRLARRHSPDVNLWDRDAEVVFAEISQAYRVLSDPSARSLYDRTGGGPATPEERGAGNGAARPPGRRGDDAHASIELRFEQAVGGVAVPIRVERQSPCVSCEGSGARPGGRVVDCGHCDGTGVVWTSSRPPRAETCPLCAGAGRRVDEACPTCRGRGVHPALVTVTVALPPGMDTGAELRVPGEGHAGPFGGPRGDLVVTTRVQPDDRFTRKGDNLYGELPLSIVEAVLGARVAVRTLDGIADVSIPPGTPSGQVFRLRGKGVPRLSGEGRGDLYVTVRVEMPRSLDARLEELFREVARLLPGPPAPAREGSVRA